MKNNENGRIEFTKQMKKEHTILIPMMLPIHFELLKNVLKKRGYNVVLLQNCSESVVETGLKYVQNDTCYPALLVIGQMIDALNSGDYDLEHTSLIITQTGGGCRASNYIHLLRKALKRAGYEKIPVISLSAGGLEKNSGFSITLPLARELLLSCIYGDCLMLLKNAIRPYEMVVGTTEQKVNFWIDNLSKQFEKRKGLSLKDLRENLKKICIDFDSIQTLTIKKVKVGIVGEIYVKYASLANNNLEEFLYKEGCEISVPGLMGFLFYCTDNYVQGSELYNENKFYAFFVKKFLSYLVKMQDSMIDAIKKYTKVKPESGFYTMKKGVNGLIGYGTKMGEGWLLTGEMIELIESGTPNIICTQPFGCLPNHISGKGMLKKLKDTFPESNIVAIDYDPSATMVNQENRIKLMLSIAKEQLNSNESDYVINKGTAHTIKTV